MGWLGLATLSTWIWLAGILTTQGQSHFTFDRAVYYGREGGEIIGSVRRQGGVLRSTRLDIWVESRGLVDGVQVASEMDGLIWYGKEGYVRVHYQAGQEVAGFRIGLKGDRIGDRVGRIHCAGYGGLGWVEGAQQVAEVVIQDDDGALELRSDRSRVMEGGSIYLVLERPYVRGPMEAQVAEVKRMFFGSISRVPSSPLAALSSTVPSLVVALVTARPRSLPVCMCGRTPNSVP